MSSSENHPRRVDGLEINEADDGLVIYDPGQDLVHHLNHTASIVFDLCDGTRDPAEITRIVAEAYSLDTPPTSDVIAGLRDLGERRLIDWEPHGAAAD